MRFSKVTASILTAIFLTACSGDDGDDGAQGPAGPAGADGAQGADGQDGVSNFVTRTDVITTNANIAYAAYADSLLSAQTMHTALEELVNNPSAESFAEAKQAWLDAREPYGQTEVYRFRVGPIDALLSDGTLGEDGEGPEGQINAWPLGEAIIDYVAPVDGNAFQEGGSPAFSGSIIANTAEFPTIDKDTIADAFEFGEDERNVTTGYHAIEFLLWGQDLNADLSDGIGNRDNTGGQRPYTDYYSATNGNAGACTSGSDAAADDICDRRGAYLLAASELLIDDLTAVTEAWEPGAGSHYMNFIAGGDVSLAKILEGMGRLSFGELAGERMSIALTTDSQEDEHSCFSDNTHRDIFLNAKGVQNSFSASYTRIDGELIEGASIQDLLVVEGYAELSNELRGSLETAMASAAVLDTLAKTGRPFDTLIAEGINQPNVRAVINALTEVTDDIEQVVAALNVTTGDLCQDTEEDIPDVCD